MSVPRASEGRTHWYKKENGEPFYTITGHNGIERNVTLRDAKKLGNIVPSVTTIIKESAKPALNNWIQEQVLLAALTLPKIAYEPEVEWIARIMEDSKQQAFMAAERGIQIHTWIQQGFEGKLKFGDDGFDYYQIAAATIQDNIEGAPAWICEKSFATDRFGGKVDLHCLTIMNFIIDIKTKSTPLENVKTYNEHEMQLAAYRRGLNLPTAKCGILFVSTLDMSAKLVWIEEAKLIRGWKMFAALLEYWYQKTGLEEK